MVTEGAGLVAESTDMRLAATIANVFPRAGVMCEQSNDPVGVELSGIAKNAAALAAGATESQGLKAAGAAAGHIFLEVWRYAERQGAKPESIIGLAGTGDLVGTADDWVAQVRATAPPPRPASRSGAARAGACAPARAAGSSPSLLKRCLSPFI